MTRATQSGAGPLRLIRRALALGCLALLGACTAPGGPAQPSPLAGLRFIGEQRIAPRQPFQGGMVGGLSSIDYDARSGDWIMASDDRSENGPARFYTARLDFDEREFRSVSLTGVHFFRQADGSTYPGPDAFARLGGEVADVEAVRFDPQGDGIWYASEGSRTLGLDPFVKQAGTDGGQRARMPLPALFRMQPERPHGPRNNLTFEGLAFAPDGKTLWLSMEGPLYQDGPPASPQQGAVSRITRLDRDGRVLAQYAYPLDRVQGVPAAGRFGDNGIAEIVALDARRLLVLERSGVQDAHGVFGFHIRLYEADVDGATDIGDTAALRGASYQALKKRLVLDLGAAGLGRIDNLEGMAWGPLLANGHASLVLVSDDNFSADQVTQLLVFEVLPASAPTSRRPD